MANPRSAVPRLPSLSAFIPSTDTMTEWFRCEWVRSVAR